MQRLARLGFALALAVVATHATATNLNEPPHYGQVRQCLASARELLPNLMQAINFERSCTRQVCNACEVCCEFYCHNERIDTQPNAMCLQLSRAELPPAAAE